MPQSPAFLITVLVLNLLTDFCIILIPIPIIWPLNISWGRKLGLMLMFCAGIFVMIAAILRVYFVLAVSSIPSIFHSTHTNRYGSLKKEKQPQSGHVERTSSRSSLAKPPWSAHYSLVDFGPAIPMLPPAIHQTNDQTVLNPMSCLVKPVVSPRAHD
jgi:hypothetical protein